MFNQMLMKKQGGGFVYPFPVDYAGQFDGSSYLWYTPASSLGIPVEPLWISAWVKQAGPGAYNAIIGGGESTNGRRCDFYFNDSDSLTYVRRDNTNSLEDAVQTSAPQRDPSQWYHVAMYFNTAEATASDRVQLFVNGVLQTDLSLTNYPGNGMKILAEQWVNYIGRTRAQTWEMNGYIAELIYVSNAADVSIDDFGELVNNTWVPKEWTRTFTEDNDVYLNFADPLDLGKDVSGNGNHFTNTGVVQTEDTPTNNFPTLDPLNVSGGSVLRAGTRIDASGAACAVTGTVVLPASGKWYWESEAVSGTGVRGGIVGINQVLASLDTEANAECSVFADNLTSIFVEGSEKTSYWGAAPGSVRIGVCVDMDNLKISFQDSVNGRGVEYDISDGVTFAPLSYNYNDIADVFFTEAAWTLTPPTGYKAICTANWPAPEVIDPSTGYEGILYTANDTDGRQVTGLNFDPSSSGLIWTKSLASAYGDGIFDSVRGGSNPQGMWDARAESYVDDFGLMTFLSNGFQCDEGTHATIPLALHNDGAGEYMANCFNALPEYGMEVVTFTGNAAIRTIPHNLGVPPELIFLKSRYSTAVWVIGYQYCVATSPWNYYGRTTANAFAAAADVFNNTAPTSSVFTLGTNATVNGSGVEMVAFLFTSVPGFSSFKGYIGNGSANGPRIHTGFRPAYFSGRNCGLNRQPILMDSQRNPQNPVTRYLIPGTNNAEATNASYVVDFLSNGVKLRGAGDYFNGNGNRHLMMAFAEMPFPFCNAF